VKQYLVKPKSRRGDFCGLDLAGRRVPLLGEDLQDAASEGILGLLKKAEISLVCATTEPGELRWRRRHDAGYTGYNVTTRKPRTPPHIFFGHHTFIIIIFFFYLKAPKHTLPLQTPTRTALAHSTRTKSTDPVYGPVSLSATGDRFGAERWIALARQRASSVEPSMREFSRQMTAEMWRS